MVLLCAVFLIIYHPFLKTEQYCSAPQTWPERMSSTFESNQFDTAENAARNEGEVVNPSVGSLDLCLMNRRNDNVAVMHMAPINTDLKIKPPQILDNTYYDVFRKRTRKFFKTSLDMGYSYAAEVPSVNVVGSGSAIKKILMEPYAAGPLSLICHKVGKTVYLDNHIFTRQEKSELLPQLSWEDEPPAANFSPQLSLYENLIWNSPVVISNNKAAGKGSEVAAGEGAELVLRENGLSPSSSDLEFPKIFNSYSYRITSENDPSSLAHLWEFHDFRMLVDVDLPIFGGGKFPSVSIHLSEETKPISVLTGIDIMLDQLMCNLSETVLVYHEHGLVKDYEVLVKEDIPHIVGSEFDPSNLKNITENIMSFLSKNMTEQGHTYWLFREKGSADMKLYDLTSICPELTCNPNWNPFLMPVVTLLYKLALDLMEKSVSGRSEKLCNVMYGLLNAAANLAENEDLAEMRACIHHSIAGVYLMYGSGEGELPPELRKLVDSLDEVLTDSYARITSSIQVTSLTRSSSSYSYDADQNTRSSNGSSSKRPPGTKIETECALQALEHCVKALKSLEGLEIDIDQKCPFKPDSPDEVAALRSVRKDDNLAVRHVFRHAILIRAASSYMPLIYQSVCLERHMKVYNFSRYASTICGAVLSTSSVPRHTSVCLALLQLYLSTLTNAAAELSGEVVNTIDIKGALTYRDRRLMEFATAGRPLKGVLNFGPLWFENNDGEKSLEEWLQQVEAIALRCHYLTREYPTAVSEVAFTPIASGLGCLEGNICRAAMSLMLCGGRCTNAARQECLEEGEKRKRFENALKLVSLAKSAYEKGIEIVASYKKKELRDCEAVLYANRAAASRLEYSIKVSVFHERVTSDSVRATVDDVCTSFRKIFEIVRPDFETQNGSCVYSSSLVDFGVALLNFSQHLRNEDLPEWKEKRLHYLEAAARAFRDVLKRKCPSETRTIAAEKLTETYYILLLLKANSLNSKVNILSAKAYRTINKEFADLLKNAQDHLIELCYADVKTGVKDIPICFADFTINFPTSSVNETQKLELCVQVLQWLMGLASNITDIEHDSSRCSERYEQLWDTAQRLLKTMNKEHRNNAAMKQAYICVLSKLPSGIESTRTLIIESLAKAITALGGSQLHPLGST